MKFEIPLICPNCRGVIEKWKLHSSYNGVMRRGFPWPIGINEPSSPSLKCIYCDVEMKLSLVIYEDIQERLILYDVEVKHD